VDRGRFLLTSLAGILAAPLAVPLAAGAQQVARLYRLGTLNLGMQPPAGTYDARRTVEVGVRTPGHLRVRARSRREDARVRSPAPPALTA